MASAKTPHAPGSGSLCDCSSPILCYLPNSWVLTVLIQALHATRGTALSPARPVLLLSYLLYTSLPHQTYPPHPGTCGSPLPGSTQPVQTDICRLLISSQDGCALLPSLFHVRFQPRANSLPVNNPNLFLLPFLPQRPLPLPVSKSILCSVPSSPQLHPSVPTRL